MTWNKFKNQLLSDKEYKKFLEKRDIKFEIAEMIIEARVRKGLTQKELAEKAGTKQPSIARVENESVLPSLGFLEKLAKAMDTYLVPPKFGFMQDYSATINLLENPSIDSKIYFDFSEQSPITEVKQSPLGRSLYEAFSYPN